jgi:hypothetical protein
MSALNEVENGQLCQSTIESLYEATGGLKQFPGLLKKIIANKAWERRVNKGKVIELSSLRELITEKPIRGWGEDPKKVEAVIKDDPECLALYREAMKEQGNNQHTSKCNNITEAKQTATGTSKAYTCERLKRVAPELFEEVKAGRMSANAAAIQAGIRKKPTAEEQCVRGFKKSQSRLVPLKVIVLSLEPHELSVIADWVKERLDGRRLD